MASEDANGFRKTKFHCSSYRSIMTNQSYQTTRRTTFHFTPTSPCPLPMCMAARRIFSAALCGSRMQCQSVVQSVQKAFRNKIVPGLILGLLFFRADPELFLNGSQHNIGGAFNFDFACVNYQVVVYWRGRVFFECFPDKSRAFRINLPRL